MVEANNIRRFQKNFANESKIKIPAVYFEITTEKVLVMEALQGMPLSQMEGFSKRPELAQEVIRSGLRAYLKMVFVDGLFHGDLHAGNFFICTNHQVG